jgi:hypothetical protein
MYHSIARYNAPILLQLRNVGKIQWTTRYIRYPAAGLFNEK